MAEGDEPVDGDGAETAAMERDEDDANWPVLSELELQVCLTDWGVRGAAPPVATVRTRERPLGRQKTAAPS